MNRRHWNRNFCSGRRVHESGQTTVEFAITVTFFILGFFGVVGLAMVFFGWLTTTNAAREGTRYLIENPTAEDAAVKSYICKTTIAFGMSEASCNANLAAGTLYILIEPSVSSRVPTTPMSVQVRYQVPVPTLRASFFNGGGITFLGPITVTSMSVMRIE